MGEEGAIPSAAPPPVEHTSVDPVASFASTSFMSLALGMAEKALTYELIVSG